MASSTLGHPAGDSSRQQIVQDALTGAREALDLDVTYFSEIIGENQVIRAVSGDGARFGIVPDAAAPARRPTPTTRSRWQPRARRACA